jgi:hypothetical protein
MLLRVLLHDLHLLFILLEGCFVLWDGYTDKIDQLVSFTTMFDPLVPIYY